MFHIFLKISIGQRRRRQFFGISLWLRVAAAAPGETRHKEFLGYLWVFGSENLLLLLLLYFMYFHVLVDKEEQEEEE